MTLPIISYELVTRMGDELLGPEKRTAAAAGDKGGGDNKKRAIIYLVAFDTKFVHDNHGALLYLFLARCASKWGGAVDARMIEVSAADNPRMVDLNRLMQGLLSVKWAADENAGVHHFVVFPMSIDIDDSSPHHRLLMLLFGMLSSSANLTVSIAMDTHFPSNEPLLRGVPRLSFVAGQGPYPAGLVAARDAVLRANRLVAPISPYA